MLDETQLENLMQFRPYPHQELEFRRYRDAPARALIWQPRTGKSKAIIDLASYLFLNGKIKSVLLIAPNGVHLNWSYRELPAHLWEFIPLNIATWRAADTNLPEVLTEEFKKPEPLWFSLNAESLMLDRVLKLIKLLIKRGDALLVVDESHLFRTPSAKRTKRLRALAKYFKYKRILTGTVIDNSPFAAYSQFDILEENALGFENFSDFKSYFGVFSPRQFGNRTVMKETGFRNLDFLQEKIASYSTFVGRESMAPFTECQTLFEMNEKQKKAYEALSKELMLEIGENTVTADHVAVKLIKLQQITCGFIKTEDGSIIDLCGPKNPRLECLTREIERTEGKIIIWCRFKEDIVRVVKHLGKENCLEYHGGVKSKDRFHAIDEFMKQGGKRFFVGQPQAGGTGINLSRARNIIWYSQIWDAIDRNQASERATKVGGESVTLIDIACVDSVDEMIIDAIKRKKSVVKEVIRSGL